MAYFFHNEYGWGNRFSFKDPIIIQNTNSDAQMDLFFINGPNPTDMLDRYTDITGKSPMPPKKLFGFNYLVQGTPINNYEAFPDWISRGYPIDNCITFTDYPTTTTADTNTVKPCADSIHAKNSSFGFYFDLTPCPGTFSDNPEDRTYPYSDWTLFKQILTARLLNNGVDWFWVDETDNYGNIDVVDERFPFHLYRAITETMEAKDSRRGFLCGRGGNAGCQRFGYAMMADISYNKACVLASINNGLIGMAHSTHDMSGADLNGMNELAYLNGVKANLLNPITQCNAWIPNQSPSHRPWDWSAHAESVFHTFLDLHYRLIPYFYSTAWQSHTKGLPGWRALLLDYPNDPAVYNLDECMIGDWLLLAPLYTSNSRDIYLPAGKWYDYFSGEAYTGPTTLSNFSITDDNEYPLFIKAGAIIPMMPAMKYVGEKVINPLTLDLYPDSNSNYTLYEDNGITRDYLNGQYCTTTYTCKRTKSNVTISIGVRTGSYTPQSRDYLIKLFLDCAPLNVNLDGTLLQRYASLDSLTAASSGWGYFPDGLQGIRKVFVKFPDTGTNRLVVFKTLVADINGDCTVDMNDLSIIAQNWLLAGISLGGVDINDDNSINLLDFAELAKYWF